MLKIIISSLAAKKSVFKEEGRHLEKKKDTLKLATAETLPFA